MPCHSKEDALEAASNFGGKNDCNTPLDMGLTSRSRDYFFPYITLGRDNEHVVIENNEIKYDYRFYYGMNANGMAARMEKGCDKPDPVVDDGLFLL